MERALIIIAMSVIRSYILVQKPNVTECPPLVASFKNSLLAT